MKEKIKIILKEYPIVVSACIIALSIIIAGILIYSGLYKLRFFV